MRSLQLLGVARLQAEAVPRREPNCRNCHSGRSCRHPMPPSTIRNEQHLAWAAKSARGDSTTPTTRRARSPELPPRRRRPTSMHDDELPQVPGDDEKPVTDHRATIVRRSGCPGDRHPFAESVDDTQRDENQRVVEDSAGTGVFEAVQIRGGAGPDDRPSEAGTAERGEAREDRPPEAEKLGAP